MPLRADPTRPFDYTVSIRRDAADAGAAAGGHSRLDPQLAYDDQTWGLLAQTYLQGVMDRRTYVDDEGRLGTELATPDGSSWAIVHHAPDGNGHVTRQAGSRRLWSELEQLHDQ